MNYIQILWTFTRYYEFNMIKWSKYCAHPIREFIIHHLSQNICLVRKTVTFYFYFLLIFADGKTWIIAFLAFRVLRDRYSPCIHQPKKVQKAKNQISGTGPLIHSPTYGQNKKQRREKHRKNQGRELLLCSLCITNLGRPLFG